MKVGVIDYGVGNLGSVMRALEAVHVTPELITEPAKLESADCLILPGVGNFADCARLLSSGGWPDALHVQVADRGKFLLGVCVGMQLLATRSMEGSCAGQFGDFPGLGLIPGSVQNLRDLGCTGRVPHVGWNNIVATPDEPMFSQIPNGTDFYFVHSFAVVCDNSADTVATTEYGINITAAIRRGRVWGTQFHPEKSSRAGARLLRNFIEASRC